MTDNAPASLPDPNREMTDAGYRRAGAALLAWFDETRRDLPWRSSRSAYRTWVSEVMLQQTRVDQVIPYFTRFVERFPGVGELAAADRDDVLKAWEGLGYYSRARNLHRAATIIADAGFPSSREAWLALPGVGPYTSAAVASILLDEPIAAVDGNVARVVSRLFAVDSEKGTAAFRDAVSEYAKSLLDEDRPGDFNEAVMDLGATVCLPAAPACTECPLQFCCKSNHVGKQLQYPIVRRRRRTPLFRESVGVVTNGSGEILVRKRPETGLLAGLWELPGTRVQSDDSAPGELKRYLRECTGIWLTVGRPLAAVKHAYSHFRVEITAFDCVAGAGSELNKTTADDEAMLWVDEAGLSEIAMPRAHRKLLDRITVDP